MKYLITLFLLIPSALSAMNATPRSIGSLKLEMVITPVYSNARADNGQSTISSQLIRAYALGKSIDVNRHLNRGPYPDLFTTSNLNGNELKILETIPNDQSHEFTVLYSRRNNQDDSWHPGVGMTAYGTEIPLGDATNGVQFFLKAPTVNLFINAGKPNPVPSDDAQNFLAISALLNKPAENTSHT